MTSVRRTSETAVGHAPPKAGPLPPASEVALRGDTYTQPGCRRERESTPQGSIMGQSYFFLGATTASLNAFAKRNFTTVLAGILRASPV